MLYAAVLTGDGRKFSAEGLVKGISSLFGCSCSGYLVHGRFADQTSVMCNATGQGSSSTIPEDLLWDFGDNTSQTGVSVTHAYANPGTYTITAIHHMISGGPEMITCGRTGREIRLENITEDTLSEVSTESAGRYNISLAGSITNTAPVPVISAAPVSGTAPLTVRFDASKSYDSDGTITAFAWTFSKSVGGRGKTISHMFSNPGTYPVTLSVTDDDGAVTRITKLITVTAPVVVTITTPAQGPVVNEAPVAVISASPSTGDAPLTVSFDASKSYDSDGTIVKYNWAFTKTALGTGKTSSYTFANGGIYMVKLYVTDNDGATGTATRNISVSFDLSHR
jgi:PKD repeat protein